MEVSAIYVRYCVLTGKLSNADAKNWMVYGRLFPAHVSANLAGVEKKTSDGSALRGQLLSFIDMHKAGSPTDANIYWVSLSYKQLAAKFYEHSGTRVSHGLVKRLLNELGYRYRKPYKVLSTGVYAQRDAQFKIIFQLVALLELAKNGPIISIDCKKKERLGPLWREGKCLSTGPIRVKDHDYKHLAKGKVIPHGIYDMRTQTGYITIGTSSETAEFVYDNLMWWWTEYGIHLYPDAQSILILCDAGGANSYRHHIFKYWMLKFAEETGVSLVICHYPPYASKWNPIEHRLFCHVHRAVAGVVFDNYQTVVNTMGNTSTETGIKVNIRMNWKYYKTGEKMDKKELDTNRIKAHPEIPELNYRIVA